MATPQPTADITAKTAQTVFISIGLIGAVTVVMVEVAGMSDQAAHTVKLMLVGIILLLAINYAVPFSQFVSKYPAAPNVSSPVSVSHPASNTP